MAYERAAFGPRTTVLNLDVATGSYGNRVGRDWKIKRGAGLADSPCFHKQALKPSELKFSLSRMDDR